MMSDQKQISQKGGTMRLGAYPCEIKKKSLAHEAYQSLQIQERHRHRWEFNNTYLDAFEKAGMVATGIDPESKLVEIRAPQPQVVRRRTVSPGAQEHGRESASAFCGVCEGEYRVSEV
jgi:CTP synthase (UTP-ammonia lyase)